MTAHAANGQRIVVGVDGSAPSKAALAWAINQASHTGAVVEVVTAWQIPAMLGYPVPVSDVDWEELATQTARDAVAEASAGAEPVKITSKVMPGNAAQALIDESAGADLLVVGNRGHGGFVEALLGSTGQDCVQHATCPVVVIRDSVIGGGAPAT
jgi:nucleotide-binding universal stress UspA family protein